MGDALVNQAFSLSDSIFLVLLIALGIAFWRFGVYILSKNDEREKRYIVIIETQADGLKGMEDLRKDVRDIKKILTVRREP